MFIIQILTLILTGLVIDNLIPNFRQERSLESDGLETEPFPPQAPHPAACKALPLPLHRTHRGPEGLVGQEREGRILATLQCRSRIIGNFFHIF